MWPHGLQRTGLPCPSLSPGICSDSCSLSWWSHSTISSSEAPLLPCLQSFPASGSFPMGWLFTSGGQSTGASASASVLPMNIQDCCPLGLAGWIPCWQQQLKNNQDRLTLRPVCVASPAGSLFPHLKKSLISICAAARLLSPLYRRGNWGSANKWLVPVYTAGSGRTLMHSGVWLQSPQAELLLLTIAS